MVPAIDIPVRNLKFAFGRDVPRFWNGGRRGPSQFFNGLSVFFPEGERFFIQSVKNLSHHVKDPKLAAEVRAFTAQEGLHTREHLRYNDMLREQGYPVDAMERRVSFLLNRAKRRMPGISQLAVTCALEHFTASLADVVMKNPGLFDEAHPALASLWRWHALEENEHKAVAFEVYKAAGGTYLERVTTMLGTGTVFVAKVLEHQVRMMAHDGNLFSPRDWAELVHFLCINPGGLGQFVPMYIDYFSPSFHPWKHDNRELMKDIAEHVGEGPGIQHAAPAN